MKGSGKGIKRKAKRDRGPQTASFGTTTERTRAMTLSMSLHLKGSASGTARAEARVATDTTLPAVGSGECFSRPPPSLRIRCPRASSDLQQKGWRVTGSSLVQLNSLCLVAASLPLSPLPRRKSQALVKLIPGFFKWKSIAPPQSRLPASDPSVPRKT